MTLKYFTKNYNKKSKKDVIKELYNLYKKLKKIEKEKEKLEKEMKKYKNPNTPSAKQGFDKPSAQGARVGRKKGKKSGHKGRTRPKDKPNKTIDVVTDVNPLTGNTNIELTGYIKEIIITDFKIEKVVTQFNCYEYRDLDTGEIFIMRHPDMPSKGIFGKNVLAFANFLRFKCRVPFDKIASAFTSVFEIPMATPTAMNICNRVADKVRPHYDKLEKEVKEAKAVNADETSARKNGVPGWLWGFFTVTLALLVFNTKRGGDIVERILGKDFKGVLGCDGWSTYAVFSKNTGILLQRCWAHAIRELKHLCFKKKRKDKSLEKAYEWFCDIFSKLKEAREYKSQEIREQLYIELVGELNNWLQVYKSYKRLRPFVKKIENAENFWFTCVLHLEIEPTNNRAERGLRAWVVLRKIIGCLRSDQGEQTTQTMLSLFQTWQLRNINPYHQLRALL